MLPVGGDETLDHIRTLLPAETLGWWRAREFSYWRRAYALYSTGHPAEAVDDYYAALKLADQQIALDADDADARENRSIMSSGSYPSSRLAAVESAIELSSDQEPGGWL